MNATAQPGPSYPRPDLLAAIVAATRHAVTMTERRRPRPVVEAVAAAWSPRAAAFREALAAVDRVNVIAECKRRSPSKGVLRSDYRPADLAAAYQTAGAAAVSVLTEPAFFDGALDHLVAVREVVTVPVLRKDFIVTEYQLLEARAAGADAALLIVAALDDRSLHRLLGTAASLGLAVLVEVHDRREIDRALAAGAEIIGVNSRNLRTLEVDLEAAFSLVSHIPDDLIAVAESGIGAQDDLMGLRRVGYDAFLVGELLMTHDDPGARLRDLLRVPEPLRRGRR